MAPRLSPIRTALPGLRASHWTVSGLYTGMKQDYVISRVERGMSEWAARGRVFTAAPGTLQLKQPGDVHRDVARDGVGVSQLVVIEKPLLEDLPLPAHVVPQLVPDDPRGAVFHRLHDAVKACADRLALEVAVAEALAQLARYTDPSPHLGPVDRAIEMIRASYAEPLTLDELAAHAGLDKFRLCRAFRAQIGIPPHAYLTRLRILRAKELLAAGARPAEVALRVGLYDQSQLNRHFKKLVGTTPGKFVARND